MRAHIVKDQKIINTVEVEHLVNLDGLEMIWATADSDIGWDYIDNQLIPPIIEVQVPQVVTMRQARLALLKIDKLNDIAPAIEFMPSPEKEIAQIEWEYATVVQRNSPLVMSLAVALNLTEKEVDDLFNLASTL